MLTVCKVRRIGLVLALASVLTGCSKMALQGALTCGLAGGVIGALLSDGKRKSVAIGAGIGAVACAAIGQEADNRRRAALERENQLIAQIQSQSAANQRLADANQELRFKLASLERDVAVLRSQSRMNDEQRYRLASNISAEVDAARTTRGRIDDLSRNLGRQIESRNVSDATRADLQARKRLLDERVMILQSIERLGGSV
jgi:surface antigen